PTAGAGEPSANAGSMRAMPAGRDGTPRGAISQTAPAIAAATAQTGGTCCCQSAPGSDAHHSRNTSSQLTSHSAASSRNRTGTTTASSASGVTTTETTGIATALASGPATETWPKSSSAAGASPTV